MKKILLTLCMGLFCLCGFAQSKGDMAVGINLGVAPCLEKGADLTNFGIGVKYQYNVIDPLRLEADIEYWAKDKGLGMFDITANAQFLCHINKFTVYPLLGIGYGHINSDYATSANRFLFNVGVGGEYNFSSKIAAGVEVKYQYAKDFQRLPINLGVTYRF